MAPLPDKHHRELGPEDGIHGLHREEVATRAELAPLAATWGAAGIGRAVYCTQDRSFYVLRDAAAPHFVSFAGAHRVRSMAQAECIGTVPVHVGAMHFDAGALLVRPSYAFLATQGNGGTAYLELVRESDSTLVASWSTSAITLTAVDWSTSGDAISLGTGGLYSLRVRGALESTTALFRGIDWRIVQ